MNWASAVTAMRFGKVLRRRSETFLHLLEEGIYETGEEGAMLLHAWSDDNVPVMVFVGMSSRSPFIPTDVHKDALDWEIQNADLEGRIEA